MIIEKKSQKGVLCTQQFTLWVTKKSFFYLFWVNVLGNERENGAKLGRVWSEEVLVVVVVVGVNILGETETMLISEAIEDNELRDATNWRS